MLDLRPLHHFIRIVDLGSLTKAAEQAHISQPALSQKMAALEREMGVRLLNLGPKGASPTQAGSVLYHHAQALLRQSEEARRAVISSSKSLAGTVTVGLSTTTAEILSLPLLEASRERHPGLRLQITALPRWLLGEMLVDGRLDVALLFDQPSRKGIFSQPLAVEELFLVTRKERIAATPQAQRATVAEVALYPLLMPRRPHPARLLLEATLTKAGHRFQIAAELDSVSVLLDAVQAGWGATLLPWSAFHRLEAQGSVIARPLAERLDRVISICVPDTLPTTSAATATLDIIADVVASLIESKTWRGLTPPGTGARFRPCQSPQRVREHWYDGRSNAAVLSSRGPVP